MIIIIIINITLIIRTFIIIILLTQSVLFADTFLLHPSTGNLKSVLLTSP